MNIKKSISLIIIIILIIGLTIYGFTINKKTAGSNIIYIKHSREKKLNSFEIIVDNYIQINNIEEYNKYVGNSNYNPDFNKYNYIFFQIGYDNCSENLINPTSYEIKDRILTVNVKYERHCGVCAISDYNYYLVKIDKDEVVNGVDLKYKATNNPHCDPNVAYKPIIYLYPVEETNITVKLGNSNYLTHTYPKYNNSWNVYAYPNGKLIDNNTGRELYGLYWEGNNHIKNIVDEGFVVKGEDTSKFLEEKLNILGLNEREADEFIIYWLPILEDNNYNYIRFETLEEINNYMSLDINPKPDSVIRVLMDYKPLDKKIDIEEQKLSTPTRQGFTVVEWGGSLIN